MSAPILAALLFDESRLMNGNSSNNAYGDNCTEGLLLSVGKASE